MKAIWLVVAAISGAGLLRAYDFISDRRCHSLPRVAETRRKVRAFAERLGDTVASAEGCSGLNGLAGDKVDAWGKNLSVLCKEEQVFAIVVRSPGPDGTMETADDIRFESYAAQPSR